MDDQTLNQSLTQTLTHHAHTAIPDDYDRWSQIQDALSQEEDPMKLQSLRVAPTTPRRTRRLIFIIAAALLLTTTAVYAVYQSFQLPFSDPGLESMSNAGNITHLNLIQRIDDVEVHLNWAYIDEGRAVFNFETFLVNQDGMLTRTDADTPFRARYWDTSNNLIAGAPVQFNATVPQPVTVTFLPPPVYFAPDVNSVDIVFELTFDQPPRVRNALERLFTGFRFSNRTIFGGNGVSKISPESTAEPMPLSSNVFTFKFSLPLIRSIMVKPEHPELVITDIPGFEFYVNFLRVDPSQVVLDFCYTPTSNDFVWSPEIRIVSEHRFVGFSTTGSRDPVTGYFCYTMTNRIHIEVPGEVTFRIDRMYRSTPMKADNEYLAIKEAFAERDIELDTEFDEEGRINNLGFPEDMDWSVYVDVMSEIGYLVEGPWEFAIEIPEQ
jgi:hypothetical protein